MVDEVEAGPEDVVDVPAGDPGEEQPAARTHSTATSRPSLPMTPSVRAGVAAVASRRALGQRRLSLARLTPTAVWRIAPAVVLALDERLGPPTDSYVNGSQTWLTDDGPDRITLEWRLHPVAGYGAPRDVGTYELWENVVAALRAGRDPAALPLGDEERPLASIWDGLECFPAYRDEIEPGDLADTAARVLGVPPDTSGLADHERVSIAWEKAGGDVSILGLLLEQLGP